MARPLPQSGKRLARRDATNIGLSKPSDKGKPHRVSLLGNAPAPDFDFSGWQPSCYNQVDRHRLNVVFG